MALVVKEKSHLADSLGRPLIGDAQAAIADIAVTVTSGTEATPNGALTIADITTPTVVELAEYCRELRAKVEALADVLQYHGLTL
jgi:hypothetical protein